MFALHVINIKLNIMYEEGFLAQLLVLLPIYVNKCGNYKPNDAMLSLNIVPIECVSAARDYIIVKTNCCSTI